MSEMNTFNFLLSALCLASAATPTHTTGSQASDVAEATKVAIKDNLNHVLKLGKCDKNAEITVTIEGVDKDLPYLFPKFDKNDTTKTFFTHFPGHFQIPSFKYKFIKYTGNKTTDYEAYITPPKVPSSDEEDAHEDKTFSLKVDFKCDNVANEVAPTKYEFTVTNDARVVSLVSSAAVLAATFFLIL
ncbi:hypothetical protein DSO57_1018767 [Entomophthora muscae]|uniref:Uncharacterized protein n=1 Tax=Entomophthora muscae TaxID=34485 RepID=A0ACC2TRS5_9FUNG|nr:hypothetical protein DSO57_1018767 [Entomophthora muscae]